MPIRRSTRIAFLVAAGVLLLVGLARFTPVWLETPDSSTDVLQRLELLTYDWRARAAFAAKGPAATNLAAIFIDDEGLRLINETLEYHWPLPRQLFGRVLRELSAQGAARVACDVFFLDRHKDYAETRMALPDGRVVSSDEFLGYQLRELGNVVLGTPGELVEGRWQALPPIPTLRTNALALGYASADRDADGVLRRVRPYQDDPHLGRIWHLGILLVAGRLGLDLDQVAERPGELRLSSTNGTPDLAIPLDREGLFYADWSLAWNDPRIFKASFTDLLDFDGYRHEEGAVLEPVLQDYLVVIGSLGSGSNISDVGATPLSRETYLVSLHWNVANSLLTGRFIRPPSTGEEALCILAMGALSAVLTWRLRPVVALVILVLTMVAYIWAGVWVFVQWRYWLPLVSPLGGAMLMTHLCMVTYRTVFEQRERRHLRSRFVKLVSPEVVDELLAQERVAVGGSMRPLTVMFADVRGFTRMTEQEQIEAQQMLAQEGLQGPAAESFLEERAQATLANVSELLAIIADEVKRYSGTLDKYIGDCVMAFWGAPVRSEAQAVLAVRAAVESQRAIAALNARRQELNEARTEENRTRMSRGERPLPMVPLLSLGIGINTGTAVVGFMGSDAHFVNYTVFGREVNLASRLEGLAEKGQIIISAATFKQLEARAPELAARCVSRPPRAVKGIAEPVAIHEVTWSDEPPGDG
ncbi:MAG: adenylate/guanylate cyclase domain-containing protein [Verrucomicrobiales bacterium]|nr:adenylate/guanylate cyclase domain-containing protein [Verrucomicrobiales bacterium]